MKTIRIGAGQLVTVPLLFNDEETKEMKAGEYDFHVVVEDAGSEKEIFETTLPYKFTSSRPVRMLVPYKSEALLRSSLMFTEQVLPVPKRMTKDVNCLEVIATGFYTDPDELHLVDKLLGRMNRWLNAYNTQHPDVPADFICEIVPEGTLGYPGGMREKAILIENRSNRQYTLGHEIGHIFDLGEEYVRTEKKLKSSTEPWEIEEFFQFDPNLNPPPLLLSPSGNYIINWPQSQYHGKKCEENPDSTSNSGFWEIDKDDQGQPLVDPSGNPMSYMACAGNYVKNGGYDVCDKKQEVKYNTLTMMSGGYPLWISGPEYRALINKLVLGEQSAQQSNILTAQTTALEEQTRVIISGIVDLLEQSAEISPLIPAANLETTPETDDPNCHLRYLSSSMLELGTFRFLPLKGELPDSHLHGPFCLVVDLPMDTAAIQVVIDGTAVAELSHTENSPTVEVLSPNGGEEIDGELTITWSASDPDSNNLSYTVEFSNDNGIEWNPLVLDHEPNAFVVDPNYLPGGVACLIKVIASDGWNRSEDVSDAPFIVTTKPPWISILDPYDGSILVRSENMQGRCIAKDPESGPITDPNDIVWSSSIDGFLGKGSLVGFELSLGEHVLSVTASDQEGKFGEDAVSVTVVKYRSDFNRDLHVNFFDWSKLTGRWLEPCSEPNWCDGIDLDYSGQIELSDVAIFAENWLKGL